MSDVGNKLAERAQSTSTAVEKTNGQPTIRDLIERQKVEVARALPKGYDPDRFTRIALTEIKKNPQLQQCTPASLLGALMLSAQTGLEPGPLGHAYLIPRKVRGVYEVQWQLGYQGMLDLVRRSGEIASFDVHEVCDNDHFDFAYGLEPRLEHTFDLRQERGGAYAYYGIAKYKDGGVYFLVMSRSDIEKRRKRSPAKDSGPWQTDYDAMARKTVVRAMWPFLPKSIETAQAVAHDETVPHGFEPAMTEASPTFIEADVIDDDPDDDGPGGGAPPPGVDGETGEVDPDADVVDAEVVDTPANGQEPAQPPLAAAPEPEEAEDAHPKAVAAFAREVRKAFPGETRNDLAKLRAGLLLHVTSDRTADTDECTLPEIQRAATWANDISQGRAEHYLEGDTWRFRPVAAGRAAS